MPALMKARFQLVRDSALLVAGIAITVHETLLAVEPRWALLAVACGMMGLPAALVADRRLLQTPLPPSHSDSATP